MTEVRRCSFLVIEPRETRRLDPASMLSGGDVFVRSNQWLAIAPHLDEHVEISISEMDILATIGPSFWRSIDDLRQNVDTTGLQRLLAIGLLIGNGERHRTLRERDEVIRRSGWWPLAALAHRTSRWSHEQHGAMVDSARTLSGQQLLARSGPAPAAVIEKVPSEYRLRLPRAPGSALESLLHSRVTCRNFDLGQQLSFDAFGQVLDRVFAARAEVEVLPGSSGLKKSNPSGGGLHPMEPYLLIHRVEGVQPGLYHYHCIDHALEPLSQLTEEASADLARIFVAGQAYFADAPVLVMLVARFGRSYWKYRQHPKVYRAIAIEVGHIAQNLYLAATEIGLGAFVTAAINEIDIEQALDLNAMAEGPMAVLGFGARASQQRTVELDPLHAVWPAEEGD